MAKSYCSVDGCPNRSDKDGVFRFFKLPAEAERRQKWLDVIGRTDLLEKKDLRPHSYCVCSAHFEDSCLITKLYLTPDAVPTKLLPDTTADQDKSQSLTLNESDKISIKYEAETDVQNTFLELADWQKKIKQLDSTEHKDFALNLYFASPHTYRLLKTLFHLPNVGTLHTLYVKIPLKLDDRVINSLYLKMQSLPNQAKYCTMCLGEMKLKPHLYYDTKEDELVGFHFIDGKVTNKLATRAYVVTLQGIFHKWRQPFSYAFLPDVEHYEDLDLWVDNLISMLLKIGVEVKAIITDQNSNFAKFAKDVKGVTIESPYFFVEERKVFYIFDVPMLLCSVRDCLAMSDFKYEENNISWKYIRALYNKEMARELKLIPKITVAHLNPENYSFQKPRVELAAQVFSRTVSAALDTYIDFKMLTNAAKATASFVQSMDNIFDVLNSSKVRSDKPLQLAFADMEEQRYVLTEALKMFSKLKPIKRRLVNGLPITETFQNFRITIQAILQLHQDFSDLLFEQFFTRRLNKDNLEILFGSIVWQEAAGAEPTPVKFSRAFSKLFLNSMLQNSACNCSKLLPNACDVLSQAQDATKRRKETPSLSSVLLKPVSMNDYRMELPEANALTYISGYLLYKCFEQHKCDELALIVKKASPIIESGRLAHYKNLNSKAPFHGKLILPPKEFVAYVGRLETAFVSNCPYLISERPGSTIFEAIMATPAQYLMCPCFPVEYCVKLFVRLRIYTTLRFNQTEIKTGNRIICVEHL